MVRYRFFLIGRSETITDFGPQFCDSVDAAKRIAESLTLHLRDLRPELLGRGLFLIATDRSGSEICRFPIDIH